MGSDLAIWAKITVWEIANLGVFSTPDTWQLAPTPWFFFNINKKNKSSSFLGLLSTHDEGFSVSCVRFFVVLLSMLLSAQIKRFSLSFMHDFFCTPQKVQGSAVCGIISFILWLICFLSKYNFDIKYQDFTFRISNLSGCSLIKFLPCALMYSK